MLSLFTGQSRLLAGRSYWKVKLSTGKTVVEGQLSFDLLRGTRNVDWHLDICSGDAKYIQEIALCTPEGEFPLAITTPYTAFQFQMGTLSFFGGKRVANAQIIGRVDDLETGACTAHIWDNQGDEMEPGVYKHLFLNHKTSVQHFETWRAGIPSPGKLAMEMMGVRL